MDGQPDEMFACYLHFIVFCPIHGDIKSDGPNKVFLADRTNGRAYATVLRLSSSVVVVCNVMYCG